jgi:hypothetical protein
MTSPTARAGAQNEGSAPDPSSFQLDDLIQNERGIAAAERDGIACKLIGQQ